MERINTYKRWLEKEGLPVVKEYSISDLMALPLQPWKRKGGLGAYINLTGSEGVIDAYLCEIPPGGTLLPQRHVYEEIIYILSGCGATTVWVEGSARQGFEWQEGSLFSPPLNAWHQHFNGQSDKPVRYFAVTRAPVSMNLFHDLDFIFKNGFVFKKRYHGEEGYFGSQGRLLEPDDNISNPKIWGSNFIPDCRTFPLVDDPALSALSSNAFFDLSHGLMSAHINEFPGGTYMKAHFHGPGAHLLCLSGQGYTLMWPAESGARAESIERIRIDWQKDSVFSPPDRLYHQIFSTGTEPARFLAFHADRSIRYVGIGKQYGRTKDVKLGGAQIHYEDEDPAIRRLFKEELAKTGAPWRMSGFFVGE